MVGSYAGNNNANNSNGGEVKSYFNKSASAGRPASNTNSRQSHKKGAEYGGGKKKQGRNSDRRFKALPRGEPVGGYIFVCNNDAMGENLRRELFGLPSRYRDSVRAIRPGSSTTLLHPPAPRHLRGRELRREQTSTRRRGRTRIAPASPASLHRFVWRLARSTSR